ncbi:ankyrin-3-like [Lineus longissimus]|uniref:ankyrin-3-like n=1 Tax=Lineus longissimus TaxID=88925 RepID=UPI00315CC36A
MDELGGSTRPPRKHDASSVLPAQQTSCRTEDPDQPPLAEPSTSGCTPPKRGTRKHDASSVLPAQQTSCRTEDPHQPPLAEPSTSGCTPPKRLKVTEDAGTSARYTARVDGHGCAPQGPSAEDGADSREKGFDDRRLMDAIEGHALIIAIEKEQADVVEQLLEQGANVETKGNKNWSLLHLASQSGHGRIVSQLLTKGADIEAKTNLGLSPLTIASKHGHEVVVGLLLDQGGDISAKEKRDWSPIHFASQNGHENVIKLLLDGGADIETKTNEQRSPLLLASRYGHETIVQLLLDRGADIEAYSYRGDTPLSMAAHHGHENVVRLLLDRGAKIDTQQVQGFSPLAMAAVNGHVNVVKLLLDRGAQIESKNVTEWTPIHGAAYFGKLDVMRILLERGADIESKNDRGQSPLNHTATLGKVDVFEFLIQNGADCHSNDVDGFSPLENSIIHGQVDLVKYLLTSITDEDQVRNLMGKLTFAAKYGKKDVITFMAGLFKRFQSFQEELLSSMAAAISHGHFECVRLLHSLGATPHSIGRDRLMNCLTECGSVDIHLYLLVAGVDLDAVDTSGYKAHDYLYCSSRIDWDIFKNALSPRVQTSVTANREKIPTTSLVDFPGLGSIRSLPLDIRSNLKRTILDNVTRITEKTKERYLMTTKEIGSMAESTKVGFPDEFDIILQDTETFAPDGLVDVGHGYKRYDSDKCHMNSSKTFHTDTWVYLKPKDDTLTSMPTGVAGDGAACTCIKMRYQDEENRRQGLMVSVDLVPVLHFADWPSNAIQSTWMMNSEELKAHGYQLVARPPHKNSSFGQSFHGAERERLYRITFSLLEVKHFKGLEDRVKDAYILTKCLRSPVVCQVVVRDEGVVHFVGEFITSYFLKTVFMHNVEDFRNHERPLVEMAYILYSHLEYYLSHGFIPMFWMPKINLLEGVDINAVKCHKVAAHMKAHVGERYREELQREPPEDVNDNVVIPSDFPVIDLAEASGTDILPLPLRSLIA